MRSDPEYVDTRDIQGVTWYQTKDVYEFGSQVWVCVSPEKGVGQRFDEAKRAAVQFAKEGYVVESALLLPRETRLRIVVVVRDTSENA
jgi:hypothetical protein